MRGPAYSLGYYASYDAAKDDFPALSIASKSYSSSATPITSHGSYSSYTGFLSGGDPFSGAGMYSTGNTPPVSTGFLSRRSMDEVNHVSLSSSPEFTHHGLQHHSRRSTSMANFAGGLARAFNTSSSNSSPPTKRRPSPAESILNMATGTGMITWGQNTIIGSGSRGKEGEGGTVGYAESSVSSGSEEVDDDDSTEIDIKILNSGLFDDEGALKKPPLLSPSKAKLYRAYREKYSDLLYAWELPIMRLDVLKYNGIKAVVDEEAENMGFDHDESEDFVKQSMQKHDKAWNGLGTSSSYQLIYYSNVSLLTFPRDHRSLPKVLRTCTNG